MSKSDIDKKGAYIWSRKNIGIFLGDLIEREEKRKKAEECKGHNKGFREQIYDIYIYNNRQLTDEVINEGLKRLEKIKNNEKSQKVRLIIEWIIRADYRKYGLNDNKELQTIQVSIEKYDIDIDDITNSIVNEKFGRNGTKEDKQRFKRIISNQIKTFIDNSKKKPNMNDKNEKER